MKYQILQAKSPINAEQLNELARDGWELVQIVKDEGMFYFYFKAYTLTFGE